MYLYSYAALTVYVISAVISGEGGWLYLANIRSVYWTVAANQVKGKRGFYQEQPKHAAMTPLRSTSHVETLPANLKDKKNSAQQVTPLTSIQDEFLSSQRNTSLALRTKSLGF